MLEIASQMILCLLLAALIGAIIGYILGKNTCADDNCGKVTTKTPIDDDHSVKNMHDITSTTSSIGDTATGAAVSSIESKPELLSEARDGKPDNLTLIKGIGAKIEEELNKVGIYHFDQIASWNTDNIEWADDTLGFPGRANREKWVSQAHTLASGEETEFSKRVDAGEVASSTKS